MRIRAVFIVVLALAQRLPVVAESPVQFSRDILPLLSAHCFQCHGPDEKARKAKLRLDIRDHARKVLLPGKAADSELIRRINAGPDDGLMPPAKTNRKLTDQQKVLLRRWIDQGAPWGKHWAYETPRRPLVPSVRKYAWTRSPIDRFVLARLERENLTPSPEASRETLIRRVTLDLTGLPPTLAEVAEFVANASSDAYERVVDRLLASPRYGERMALDWLDGARYADTNGYQNDFARTMWPWRDWVVSAFNDNMPLDRFIIEQIAGDLLPNASLSQRIASGFNRNHRTVTEAGSIDEEWRVENVVDRVETTSTVLLGLTMGCGRCHDHKYDPISQKEFYQFYAFFNSIAEQGVYTEQRGNVAPLVAMPSAEDRKRLKTFDAAIDRAEQALREQEAALRDAQLRWERDLKSPSIASAPADWFVRFPLQSAVDAVTPNGTLAEAVYRGTGKPHWIDGPFGKGLRLDGKDNSFIDAGSMFLPVRTESFAFGGWVRLSGNGAVLSKMDDGAQYRGFDMLIQNGKVEVHLVHAWPDDAIKVVTQETIPREVWAHVLVSYNGSGRAAGLTITINGRPARLDVHRDHLTGSIETQQPLRLGKRSTGFPLNGALADLRIFRRAVTPTEAKALATHPILEIVRKPEGQRTPVQREFISQVFRQSNATDWRAAERMLTERRKEKAEFEKRFPTVMVMAERATPRETFVLKRGRYDMPDKGQKVQPGVPACLPPLPTDAPPNRLGLARWLVSPDNPLVSRVLVNRIWERFFGMGLVKTAEDFGLQGEPPSHPELLDWLATELIRLRWDAKALERLMVTSAAYRQASAVSPDLLLKDPENRLLARGPRHRLPAEVLRDNALAVSGLLVERIGGPPIKPYQPAGLWEELAGGAGETPYVQDKGGNLYRRSLYIYRKRTVPHPVMAVFDAPSREICQVKRSRTNTPLQALELLNDVTYHEAARRLAERMLSQGGRTPEERLAFAFRLATARPPQGTELQILLRGLKRYRGLFSNDRATADQFIRLGDSPIQRTVDPVELAAYTAAAAVILNLDETVTKE